MFAKKNLVRQSCFIDVLVSIARALQKRERRFEKAEDVLRRVRWKKAIGTGAPALRKAATFLFEPSPE